jgi:hypothetical protein
LLYETNIPQIQDVITELILFLPLKSRVMNILFKARSLSDILVNSLKMSDNKIIARALKLLDSLFVMLSHKEIKEVFNNA